ncbi:MAG: type II toxin-antitoxin system prevent-host-death family antitoxin [Deltaproteobacteria bacterium]|nr:type II toxin-antitoxin system prevent-host-death family antitoxin [Deltaproteobacteria bacterium]
METTAISKLKASLSEYLSKVKAGEEVLVTERGKPIAKIIPLERDASEISAHLLTLERAGLVNTLERAGLVNIGTGKLPPGFWDLTRPKDNRGLALNALLEEREEAR